MIIEALLDFLQGCVSFVVGLVPDFTVPAWLDPTTGSFGLGWLANAVGYMGNWVPWTLLFTVLAAVWVVRVAMIGVSILMKIYAMVRGGAS